MVVGDFNLAACPPKPPAPSAAALAADGHASWRGARDAAWSHLFSQMVEIEKTDPAHFSAGREHTST
eukprot:6626395-Pyramimonas_sp.AAC.1